MNYYFVGIGGIGMSAIARFFKWRGDEVSGYDRTPSPLTAQLEAEGIRVHYDDNEERVPKDVDMVVYTPAVPEDTRIMKYVRGLGVPVEKRSQMLGELTRGKKCIAVAGTHGKTTTSSMIAWLLHQSHIGCSAFLGGIAKNFKSNMVVNNESEYVVVEADEYDRSFLQLYPYYSVITATDPDHLDIYGTHENLIATFGQYACQTKDEGGLLLKEGLKLSLREGLICHNYSSKSKTADYYCENVENEKGNIFFDLHTPKGMLKRIELPNSCLFNAENAVAASAVALKCGLSEEELRRGFLSFEGIKRRFDYRVKNDKIIYIDDYAHHPAEIKATLDSVRYMFPKAKVMGIFQPHLYTRTRDFADEFAKVLSTLDQPVLLDIYPARELPIEGVTSKMLLDKIDSKEKQLVKKEEVIETILKGAPDIVLTLGAGDIDRLVPKIEKALQ